MDWDDVRDIEPRWKLKRWKNYVYFSDFSILVLILASEAGWALTLHFVSQWSSCLILQLILICFVFPLLVVRVKCEISFILIQPHSSFATWQEGVNFRVIYHPAQTDNVSLWSFKWKLLNTCLDLYDTPLIKVHSFILWIKIYLLSIDINISYHVSSPQYLLPLCIF